jgi:hypothetical protein
MAIAAATFLPVAVGCMGDGGADCPAPPVTIKDGASEGTAEAGDSGAPPIVGVRVANLSPDAPAFDFCLAPHGTNAFQGPLLAQAAASASGGGSDAAVAAVTYPTAAAGATQVASAYIYVKPDAYDARLVVAGAPDCSFGIMDLTGLPTPLAGAHVTIALTGMAQSMGLKLIDLPDDTTPPPPPDGGSPKLYVRFLHAAPGLGPVDVTFGSKVIFPAVSFRATSPATTSPEAGAKIDTKGYWSTGMLNAASVAVLPSGGLEGGLAPLVKTSVTAAAGAVITLALIGEAPAQDASGAQPLQVLECVDNGATVGLYANCTILPLIP